ncbi:MAG: ABC transporter ATP-binding protein [Acidobacteriota bacterium]
MSQSSSAVLEVTRARRSFGKRAALDGVSLAIHPGEIYALLGPNGAGKTSLIRAICGQVRLDDGTVTIGGRDPRRDPQARRWLGLVPQEIALWDALTARENLATIGRLSGVSSSEIGARVDEALQWIGLPDRAASRLSTLSGGMKRRVNIAAGLLHRPTILLLDEPTVGVDPQARLKIHEMLLGSRAQRVGMLLTTHDLAQAEELADRIGVLDEGRLLAEGTLTELIAKNFGDERRLAIRLAAPPEASAGAALRESGLIPHAQDERRWSGAASGGFEALGTCRAQIERLGLSLIEISLAEPSLADLFFHLTGKELRE